MLKEMGKQLMKYTNQARFVQMIIKKELVVSGRKRSEIIEDLMKKKFDKISNKAEAQKAGETEDTVEEEDSTVGDGYNYLLGVRTRSFYGVFVHANCSLIRWPSGL